MDPPPLILPSPPPLAAEPHSINTLSPSHPSHPPYPEMILSAVAALREETGSSKIAISKYIEQVYPNLPPAHPALLTHHLQQLRISGHLIINKKSYMLPIRSGGGGPIEPVQFQTIGPIQPIESPENTDLSVKKKRGRPPKEKGTVAEQLMEKSGGDVGSAAGFENGVKKRRGRPPKVAAAAGMEEVPLNVVPIQQTDESAVDSVVFGGDGGGVVTVFDEGNGVVSVKRGRGRPPKKNRIDSQAVGGEIVVQEEGAEGFVVKRRGRPKGSTVGEVVGVLAAAGQVVAKRRGRPPRFGKAGGKRRGRPPKYGVGAGGVLVPGRRPPGRPRKNFSTVRGQPSVDAEEQTRKLEFMQACIKSAVTVLKPHVNPHAVDAQTALLRLEELITWNVNPAPKPIVRAPPPAAASVPSTFNEMLPQTSIEDHQLGFGDTM